MDKKKHVTEILKRLRKEHAGTPQTALNFSTAFELLVATILSAQTTDVQVNKVTEKLFKKYRTIEDFANTAPDKLEKDVASVNFYRNKARNISNAAKMIIEQFGGKVPETMEELIERALEIPHVRSKQSRMASPRTHALYLADEFAAGPPEAFIDDHEFCHLHALPEGNLHLTLPSGVREHVIQKAWGEVHPSAAAGLLGSTLIMVYAPRNEDELAAVLAIVQASYRFARGTPE